MFPGREIASLKVVPSIGHDHLTAYTDYFGLVDDDSSVVESCLVENGTSQIDDDVISDTWDENVLDDIPGMEDGVVLEEVVVAVVAWDLEFSANPHAAIEAFALFNTFHDVLVVLFEIKRVIVETAKSQLHMKLPQLHQ